MGTEALKQALDDCVINFDRRVLITDLLQEYQLSYKEVNEIVTLYVASRQEKGGAKFEKSFLVIGEDKESSNEMFAVVKSDSELQEWSSKLKNVESMLYSVEIAGGAKSAADIFKPMTWCSNQMEQIDSRPPLKWNDTTNGVCNGDTKALPKVEPKKSKGFDFGAKKSTSESQSVSKLVVDAKETKKASPETKKASPETKQSKEKTPEKRKPATSKAINKKGIASFFGSQTNTAKSETKKATGVVKPPTPKKMRDFFQKSEKPAATTPSAVKSEKTVNTSVQLFCDDDEDGAEKEEEEEPHSIVEVDTSDDERQLESLRRQCSEKDGSEIDTSNAGGSKRRRIIDSDDDDEEPEVKHEKKDEKETEKKFDIDDSNEAGKSETFLDEDGFVITIKSKKAAVAKKPVKPTTPEKSPPTKENAKKSTKPQQKQTPKTKQGNIMSFFNKK